MIPLWPLKASYLIAIVDAETSSPLLRNAAQAELDYRLEADARDELE